MCINCSQNNCTDCTQETNICNQCQPEQATIKNKNLLIGIYKITSPTGRVYIGQSINLRRRMKSHKKASSRHPRLRKSILKYWWENHQFDIIEYCSAEELNCSERFWQDQFEATGKNGLNCNLVQCGEKRYEHSEETKKKMSENMKGEKNPMYGGNFSEDHRSKISKNSSRHNLGKIFSEEIRIKMKNNHADVRRGKHPNAKLVMSQSSGIFYDCCEDAAETYSMKSELLGNWLLNPHRNKTDLIYV